MKTNLRIGVITSSNQVRDHICEMIADLPWADLAWFTHTNNFDIHNIKNDKPDLLFLSACDEVDQAVAITDLIMRHSPLPILLLCDSVSKHASIIFEAMGKGAIDVIDIPGIYNQLSQNEINEICRKLKTVSKLINADQHPLKSIRKNSKKNYDFPLIVIGASTGGPASLAELLSQLPTNIPAAIIVVQHIDDKFSDNLSQWLDAQINIPVEIAKDGQSLSAGKVFLAAGSSHLVLTDSGKLAYTQHPENSAYKPCIDILFFSVAEHWHGQGIAVLLTGMGSDGAGGLLELRESGFISMAQNKDSCAVFGMPAAAIKISAAEHIESPGNMAKLIIRKLEHSALRVIGK